MKRFSIFVGLILVAGGAAGIVVDQTASDSWRERLCAIELCDASAASGSARDLLVEDRAGALRLFQKALARDPASPYRWCDVGDALLVTGDLAGARHCFTRAHELGRDLPVILLRVANFHFGIEEPHAALPYTSRALALTSAFDDAVFRSYDWAGVDAREILNRGIPVDQRTGQQWFQHVLETRSAGDAAITWAWLTKRGFATDQMAAEYLDLLVKNRDYRTAAETWRAYLGSRAGDYPKSNSLYNGGFESEPTGAIFDWRIEPAAGVEVTLDSQTTYAGRRSLKLNFAGEENLAYHHVAEIAYVPAGRYRFQAFVRTEGITTDEGLRFRIFDPDAPGRFDVTTAQTGGTSAWMKVEKTFTVPRETGVVKVEIMRRPSEKFNNKIAGVAWVDAVSLTRID